MARLIAPALACALALALTGCGLFGIGGPDAPASVSDVPRERSVDPDKAASLINAWRAKRGRAPLAVDPTLTAIAAETAQTLAKRDTMNTDMHTASGLERRLAGRFEASHAAENLGAGYPTLAQTVDGWKASRHHNDNLVNPDLTRMGIGLALTDKGAFHSYWVLILARPPEQHRGGPLEAAGPPGAGPPLAGALVGVPLAVSPTTGAVTGTATGGSPPVL